MAMNVSFTTIDLAEITPLSDRMKDEGWRVVQILAHIDEASGLPELTYTFGKGNDLTNYQVKGFDPKTPIPSISDNFISVFPFENEANELYGLNIQDIAIDFSGHFYDLAVEAPMTVVTPEELKEREKRAKLRAAREAKAKKDAAPAMDPKKDAKVKAAMEAKKKRDAATSQEKGE